MTGIPGGGAPILARAPVREHYYIHLISEGF
nr:MAG TPA: hypothetical protein [Caudoviricetes sp.]